MAKYLAYILPLFMTIFLFQGCIYIGDEPQRESLSFHAVRLQEVDVFITIGKTKQSDVIPVLGRFYDTRYTTDDRGRNIELNLYVPDEIIYNVFVTSRSGEINNYIVSPGRRNALILAYQNQIVVDYLISD